MIVVFGAGGFIGSYLINLLVDSGISVLATDIHELAEVFYKKHKIPFINVDITNPNDFNKLPLQEIAAIVNLACLQPVNVSKATYNPSNYIRVNVEGTLNILDYCRRSTAKTFLCTVSHRGVQGVWDKGIVITEDSIKELKYTGDYTMFSISECAAVDCVYHYARAYELREVILRIPPVYGYGPHLEGFTNGIPLKSGFMNFIENAQKGSPIEVWGDSSISRDIIYVKDVVSAIFSALKNKNACGLYNISSGVSTSLQQEVDEIINVFSSSGNRSNIIYNLDKPNSIESFHYDISKANKDFGWYPRFSTHDMLLDIKEEMLRGRFNYLLDKRKHIFAEVK